MSSNTEAGPPVERRGELQVVADVEALARTAAAQIAASAEAAITAHGVFHLVLTGGTTPARLYALLATPAWRTRIAWSRTHLWWGDERYVPYDHADSNVLIAAPVVAMVPPGQVHPMPTEPADPLVAAADYAAALGDTIGVPPRFDLVLMGLGPDGHTASLFPGHPEPFGLVGVVSDSPKPPPLRLTLTARAFSFARCVIYLVAGAEKAAALQNALYAPYDPVQYPTHRIVLELGSILWLADQAAASLAQPLIPGPGQTP